MKGYQTNENYIRCTKQCSGGWLMFYGYICSCL